jgi:DNA-binding transcriptional LysR family regulator
VLVARAGDIRGFVDDVLAEHGLERTVVLTVPSFMWALAALAQSDLVAALPRMLVRAHGSRFGVVAVEPPMRMGRSRVTVVASRAAMADAGVALLVGLLERVLAEGAGAAPRKRRKRG